MTITVVYEVCNTIFNVLKFKNVLWFIQYGIGISKHVLFLYKSVCILAANSN
jgi:hypothetical protein